MTIAEQILEAVRALSETQARQVLDFVSFLKSRRMTDKSAQRDMSTFDRFGAVYDGRVDCDELHDRKVFR